MKKLTFAVAVAVLLFAAVSMPGCDNFQNIPNIPENFDYGSWTDSTYRNDFFGLSITVPKDWYISGKEEADALFEEVLETDIVNKKEVERVKKITDITSANLFLTSRYSVEEAVEKGVFNPNIVLTVENISSSGPKIDRATYVKLARQHLVKGMPGIVFKSQTNKTVGGQEFTSLQTELHTENVVVFQEYLVCLKNGFAVLFCLTSFEDSEKESLDAIMTTLKWD